MKSLGLPRSFRALDKRLARTRAGESSRSFRPHLERLEYRCLLSITPSTVVANYAFYNNSHYDNGGVGLLDDAAIATDKSALTPGHTATFSNVTSFTSGINGVMFDISGDHPAITAADFTFQVGNNESARSWTTALQPVIITIRGDAGLSGADRVEIIWDDGAIKNQWLEVTIAANERTGLATSAVFLYGNQVGDSGTGNTAAAVKVDATDELGARSHGAPLALHIPTSNIYDYNRDGKVDTTDQLTARNNGVAAANGLKFLNLAAISPPALSAALASDTGNSADSITTNPTIAGSLTAANSLVSFKAGLNSGPVTTDVLALRQPDGSFTLDESSLAAINGGPLADGAYLVKLETVDSQGLSAAVQVPFTLKRSILATNLPDLIDADDTGTSNIDNITKINTPHIAVAAETVAISLLVDNVVVAQGTGAPGLQFTLSTLSDGVHQIKAIATDGAGNTSTSPVLSITVSTAVPTISAKTLATVSTDSTPHVTVTASGPLGLPDGTQISLDVDVNNDGDFNDAGETARTTTTIFNGGAYFQLTPDLPPSAGTPYLVQYRARITDVAGNQGTSALRSLKIDTGTNDILKNYVNAIDPTTSYTLSRTDTGTGYKYYTINLKSQTWRTAAEVNKPLWQHWLQIVVPTGVVPTTALLFIDGGSNTGSAPPVNTLLVQAALAAQAILVYLPTAPNEPLTFTSDHVSRTEDSIIAYTFNQYVTHQGQANNDSWPALEPMVKSAKVAMDVAQAFVPTKAPADTINDFIVTGFSKRGRTTWLTAAVDSRVKAIIPGVYDNLNAGEQVIHQYGFYGNFSTAIGDYVGFNIPQNSLTPQGQDLGKIIDPYVYRNNGKLAIPKLLINSPGDQFFVPDGAQFYFSDLAGTKNYLRYIPNTGHELNDSDPVTSEITFFNAIARNSPLPQFSWTIQPDNSIRVQTGTIPDDVSTPIEVKLWQATNNSARDFRYSAGIRYTDIVPVTDLGGGVYVASVPTPANGATAFFVELTFPNLYDPSIPYVFTTEVKVVSNIPLTPWPFFMPSNGPSAPQGAMGGDDDDNLSAVAFSLVASASPTTSGSTPNGAAAGSPDADDATDDAVAAALTTDETLTDLMDDAWSLADDESDTSVLDVDAVDLALAGENYDVLAA